jgi:glycosyltransferase involved in cell wall biosynthesis
MSTVLSVIVCTRNPRPDYLRRVLESLRGQSLRYEHWELLLVDNASDRHLAETWDLSWHPRARHVREDEVGLTPARLRGIAESCGELLVFVDDDNVLASDFLAVAASIPCRHPHLGAFGSGCLEPEFEVPPSPELVPRLPIIALRTVPRSLWSNNPTDFGCIPWGAGLVVKRGVADAFPRLLEDLDIRSVIGRKGQRLFCGEDDLFSWISAEAGLGFGIFPQLRIKHLIPSARLSQSYLLRLNHDQAFSHGILHYLLEGAEPRRIGAFRVARFLAHGLRRGTFSMRCEWAAARGEAAAERFIARGGLRPVRRPNVEPELLADAMTSRVSAPQTLRAESRGIAAGS